MNRREFLLASAAAPLVAFVPLRLAHAAARWDRVLVLIELQGGNDGLNTVIPYIDPLYAELRPTLKLPRERVLQLDEKLGLAREFQPLMPYWQQKQLGVVLGVGYPDPNLSHFRGIDIWHTATDSDVSSTVGWLAELFKQGEAPPADFAADGIVVGRGNVGPLRAPDRRVLVLENGGAAAMNEAKRMAGGTDVGVGNAALQHLLATQQQFKMSSAAVLAKNVDKVDPGATFPAGDFGGQMKMAAQLLVGGVQVPVIKATLNGFDTHANQLADQPPLHAQLAEGLAAFAQSMQKHNLWDRVLVMTYSEFGRRAHENGSGGTDHGTAAPHFVLGGKVKGGLYGAQPSLRDLNAENLVFTTHFRRMYATAAQEWWGISTPFLKEKPLGLIA
jgi:uncharacterized protein (DUF1501 family)